MNIFVTGATGYVGGAAARALLRAGHSVTGMGRDKARAAGLEAQGMRFVQGELSNTKLLTQTAASHEAVVHAASDSTKDRVQLERAAVEALLEGARSGAKVFVYTSGIWVLGPTGPAGVDETVSPNPISLVAWRPAMEGLVMGASRGGLRTAIIRPGVVYGGRLGILAEWWTDALAKKVFRIVGDGANRWPLVHHQDLGELYRCVVEKGNAAGVYHGTDDTALRVSQLAGAVAQATGARFEIRPLAEARTQLGPYAEALALDQWVMSPASRQLGWTPTHKSFLDAAPALLKEFQGP